VSPRPPLDFCGSLAPNSAAHGGTRRQPVAALRHVHGERALSLGAKGQAEHLCFQDCVQDDMGAMWGTEDDEDGVGTAHVLAGACATRCRLSCSERVMQLRPFEHHESPAGVGGAS